MAKTSVKQPVQTAKPNFSGIGVHVTCPTIVSDSAGNLWAIDPQKGTYEPVRAAK